ncbi:hypothetical protein ScPMuIL_006889 [Solemya velum]
MEGNEVPMEPSVGGDEALRENQEKCGIQTEDGNTKQNENDITLRYDKQKSCATKDGQLCGWLTRVNAKGIVRINKRRWSVFSDKLCKLYFYSSPRDLVLPLAEIDISCASLSFDPSNVDKPGLFQIRSEGKEHLLDAHERHQMMHWLQELQKRRRAYSSHLVSLSKGNMSKLWKKKSVMAKGHSDKHDKHSDMSAKDDDTKLVMRNGGPSKSIQNRLNNFHINRASAFNNFKAELQSVVAKFSSAKTEKPEKFLTTPVEEETTDQDWQMVECCGEADVLLRPHVRGKLRNLELKIKGQNTGFPGQIIQSPPSCSKCSEYATNYDLLKEELKMSDTELQATREIVHVLQKEVNSIRREMATRFDVENKDDHGVNLMLIERDYSIGELEQTVSSLRDDNYALSRQIRVLEEKLKAMSEEKSMFHDMLKAKSETIMQLTNQVFDLENGCGAEKNSQHPPLIKTVSLGHQSLQNELQDARDLCEAYEEKNKFLTEEIRELSGLRANDEERERLFSIKCASLEALYYKTQSKYLFLLKEVNSPTRGGDEVKTQEAVDQLLQDALDTEDNSEEIDFHFTSSTKEHDRYGFVRKYSDMTIDDPLVGMATRMEMMSDEVTSRIKEAVSDEAVSHQLKWTNFMVPYEQGGKPIQRSPELKALIRSGVPHEYKESIWKACIYFHVRRVVERWGPQYYNELVQKSSKTGYSTDPAAKQIELDLLRTLPDNKHFDSMEQDGIKKLRHILLAFSWHNPNIGYCQGLNRLAAILLLFLSEEDSFWGLVAIVEHIMPQDYFNKTLLAAQADQVLFRFGVAFFKFVEDELLQQTDSLDVNKFLRTMGENMTDIKSIAYIAFNSVNPFPMRLIATKRHYHLQQTRLELAELDRLREEQQILHSGSTGSFSSYISDDEL